MQIIKALYIFKKYLQQKLRVIEKKLRKETKVNEI